ncbi:MAG: tetratricopeptide repeat protein [Deltaproteobacteria bacterium]|nr:tetratricopeptide repeat protein [Deltaproteobacteria bacterium]
MRRADGDGRTPERRSPHRPRRRRGIAVALIASLAFGIVPRVARAGVTNAAGPDAEGSSAASALARVAQAAAAHPDDPDLAFTHARHLARAERAAEALEATRRFVKRWPRHRPDAHVEIARTLLEHGAAPEARSLLDEAVRRRPDSGLAHFYRGIALRAEREPRAAEQAFQAAALLEPTLRSESLLARALLLFELAREQEAVSLLQEILRVDPTSDTALRARLLLRDREVVRGGQRLRAEALAGFEWDDNVTLEGTESEVVSSRRDDFRGVWGAGLSGQPWLGSRGGLLLGYRYDQTMHHELDEFDVIQNALFASLSALPSESLKERLALRFDLSGYDTLQDLDRALSGGALRSNLLLAFGKRGGVARLFGAFELAEFHADPGFDAWERDSFSGGLGVEHTLPLPPADSSVSLSASWLRTITQASPDGSSDGFDGDFDNDSYRLRALGRFALPWSLRTQLEASYSRDEYLNDNFAHALESLANGQLEIEARRDDVVSGRIALSRALVRHARLEVYWRGTRRISNVDLFDYDKQVVGLLVHVSTD